MAKPKANKKQGRAEKQKAQIQRAPQKSNTLTLVTEQRVLRDLALLVSVGLETMESNSRAFGELAPDSARRAAMEMYVALARAWQSPSPLIVVENNQPAPSEIIKKKRDQILRDYEEDAFWSELEERLAERDFARVATDEERRYVNEHGGELPASADRFFNRWRQELDTHGIDRLSLDSKSQPVPSLEALPPSPSKTARVRKVFTALVVARYVRASRKKLTDLTDLDKKSIAELASSHLEIVPEALIWSLAGNENAGAVIDALNPFLPKL